MKQMWNKLNAKQRRIVVVVAAAIAFGTVVAMAPQAEREIRSSAREDNQTVRNVLTDRDTDSLRVENLLAQINNLRNDHVRLTDQFEIFQQDIERMEFGNLGPRMTRETEAINARIDTLIEQLARVERSGGNPLIASPIQLPPRADGTVDVQEPYEVYEDDLITPPVDDQYVEPIIPQPTYIVPVDPNIDPVWNQPPAPIVEPTQRGRQPVDPALTGAMRVIEYQPTEEELAALAEMENIEEELPVYLPPGSIVTGTIMTGMDAPTGRTARQDPHPALIRIKHEAILPNHFTADIRECFLILGGYGDLSSERAYLRGETLSCIRDDGKVIESQLEAYAVGEDGKAGIRGRLVSKQGQILAKSLTAGALQGFASAFDKAPVPRLSLGEEQLYEQAFSSDTLQSGVVGGVGGALDRLAQFYLDQAEGMFPVIEIDAGREIEIILVRGGTLSVRN